MYNFSNNWYSQPACMVVTIAVDSQKLSLLLILRLLSTNTGPAFVNVCASPVSNKHLPICNRADVSFQCLPVVSNQVNAITLLTWLLSQRKDFTWQRRCTVGQNQTKGRSFFAIVGVPKKGQHSWWASLIIILTLVLAPNFHNQCISSWYWPHARHSQLYRCTSVCTSQLPVLLIC